MGGRRAEPSWSASSSGSEARLNEIHQRGQRLTERRSNDCVGGAVVRRRLVVEDDDAGAVCQGDARKSRRRVDEQRRPNRQKDVARSSGELCAPEIALDELLPERDRCRFENPAAGSTRGISLAGADAL